MLVAGQCRGALLGKNDLRRETRKVDRSEGRQGEDAKEGAAHIVALLA